MLADFRPWCFRLALIAITIASTAVIVAWTHPFPLISDGQGGYSDARNFYAMTAALGFSLLALLFAVVSAKARTLLVLGSIGLFLLSCVAMLSNGH
jgi:hypothetical protein